MATQSRWTALPIEIVGLVLENVSSVPDLLSCACVSRLWNTEALKRLYHGSLNDMQFRSPDIGSLNSLFVASRKRFACNLSFTKHLLICPERPATDDAARPIDRLACFEKCRAIRRRRDAQRLLQPGGKQLSSLLIPFEIVDQDWSQSSDLLLTETIDFLAIDISYCELLADSLSHPNEPIHLTENLSNLRALTIYYPQSDDGISELCQVLQHCSLHFLHLENQRNHDLTRIHTTVLPPSLLTCIKQQQRLEALALKSIHCNLFEDPGATSSAVTGEEVAWPSLKALYVRICNRLCLEQLPKFKEIQIVVFERATPMDRCIDSEMAENIAACQNLRVLDLVHHETDKAETILKLVQGCPQLRKLRLGNFALAGRSELVEDTFLYLLHGLPCLEFLELRTKFRLDGSVLHDAALHCPHLVVLKLPQARLCLSRMNLISACPLLHLKSLSLHAVWFESPHRLIQPNMVNGLAAEWRRVFPKVRAIPCPGDQYSQYWDDDVVSTEGIDEMRDDEETSLGFDDYDTNWFILRVKLWKTLGYEKGPFYCYKVENMWQTNLEMDMINWPVVPFEAFIEPNLHSTIAREIG